MMLPDPRGISRLAFWAVVSLGAVVQSVYLWVWLW